MVDEIAPPFDVLTELKRFVILIELELKRLVDDREFPTGIMPNIDSPRLRKEFEKIQDRLLENRVDIDRLQGGRGHPPSKSKIIRPAFFQALLECEIPEDQIQRAYDRFQAIYEPASPATQRVRRSRTKAAISGPVAAAQAKAITEPKAE